MAATQHAVNHPLTQRIWAKKLFVDTLEDTVFGKFIGEGTDSLIQLKTDLKKDKGDNIRVGLRMQLTGSGVQGDTTLEGNEEALVLHNDTVYLDQLRHAVRSSGYLN